MDPEIACYGRYIREKIEKIRSALADLSEEELNTPPPGVPGANSAFVIATHTYGNMRAWILGIVAGQALRRDRPGEFASRGTYDQLGEHARELTGDIDGALLKLDPKTLGDWFTPSQEHWGEGTPTEIERRGGFVHVLEHAGIHLGHIHMTVDLLKAQR
ncbi:MAG: DinB family protein [Chloroflexota bacterium]